MTNLEFIEKQIDTYKRLKERAILNIADEDDDDELFKLHERIDIINERLPILQQIKNELEAWEIVKEELQIVSRGKNRRGEKLQRYELCVIGQDKINTLEKGLGIEKC